MQHAAWVIAPLVLAAVLTFSAVAKFGKGASLRKILRNLHLPDSILPMPLARAIPGIEIALVMGLLTPWTSVFTLAAAGALALMLVYWALIARGLTITPRPSCGCFGQAGDHRISARTLVRNTLLVTAAGGTLALAGSGQTVWTVLSDAGEGDWLWLGFTALACAVTGLVLAAPSTETTATQWAVPDALTGAPTTTPATSTTEHESAGEGDYLRVPTPQLLLHDPESGPVTLQELSGQRAQLLVFVSCYCASTGEVISASKDWQARLDLVDVRVVFSVPIIESVIPTTPPGSLVDHRGLAHQALQLSGSPNAVLLGVDGYLAGGPVSGPDDVRLFIDDIEESLREAPAPAAEATVTDDASQSQGQLTGDR